MHGQKVEWKEKEGRVWKGRDQEDVGGMCEFRERERIGV